MDRNLYNYKAELTNVVDGDTIDITIDLGFGINMKKRVRIYGIDTPELRSRNPFERLAAQNVKHVVEILLNDGDMYVKTIKDKDKYGRYLAEVFIVKHDIIHSLSDYLVLNELAKVWTGSKKLWTKDELDVIIEHIINEDKWV